MWCARVMIDIGNIFYPILCLKRLPVPAFVILTFKTHLLFDQFSGHY
jgi:hypothetical protein